ncbi:MAG TPA: L,D-transpeptidase family protein [Longimicrobium sp.]|jgi:lipoprotein-anchoring transpeptidase ErfK/SrfK
MLLSRRAALAALFVLSSASLLQAQLKPTVVPAATPIAPAVPVVVRPSAERWAQITPVTANARVTRFPVGRGHAGPAVLRVQTLLDRALFSPGMIDGRWGQNTEVALYWLQVREGLPATGAVDSATMSRLEALAGNPDTVVHRRELRPEDVRGPFTKIPDDIYQQAKLTCSCYESLTERLTEIFHSGAGLLRQLNPGIKLDSLVAGDSISVPLVRPMDAPAPGTVAELWVSGSGRFVHAMSAEGRILYHFPTTLGGTFDPSPQGDFSVASIHENPWWHYQPRILAHVPDDRPDARIPPGPNNAVGRVWMSLSAPHYGIHGTKSPETIGYATSAGCVRLTNWDVLFLSRRVPLGTPVRFRDTRPGQAQPDGGPAVTPRDSTALKPAPRDSTIRRDSVPPKPAPRDTSARPSSIPPRPAPRDTSARRDSVPPQPASSPPR